MDKVGEVLRFLRETGGFVSGDYISAKLGVSRTAIWKYINQLERHGYDIVKSKGKGYRLTMTPDKLYAWEIDRHRDTALIGRKIVHKESLESTNVMAFKLASAGEAEGTCVVTEVQSKGKGRLGRVWSSPAGKNIYCSIILRPAIHPSQAYPITFLSSLAVYDTVEAITGTAPTLKWPNDVLMNGRKICGTLLELSTEADMVRFVVVGIGLNVNMGEKEVPEEIQQKASSLLIETKKTYERSLVCGMLFSALERYYARFKEEGAESISRLWEEKAGIKGRFMEITQMGETHRGICIGVDSDGAIILDVDGVKKKIIAGDVKF